MQMQFPKITVLNVPNIDLKINFAPIIIQMV